MEKKIIRDGKVAVAVSRGFGAGWTTWNQGKISPFEPKVIAMIEEGKQNKITEDWCIKELKLKEDDYVCTLGVDKLEIQWVDEGEKFSIDEYDGAETLYISSELMYVA